MPLAACAVELLLVSHAFCSLVMQWSRYWCVERIQSRKTKYINASGCVVEVIAQFFVLLVVFLAPREADLGGRQAVTLHRM